jgi:hypothetical protein
MGLAPERRSCVAMEEEVLARPAGKRRRTGSMGSCVKKGILPSPTDVWARNSI